MRILRLSLILFMLFLGVGAQLAYSSVKEIDIESIKAPPRDVKDILKLLDETKPDFVKQEKAKKIVSLSEPDASNLNALNAFYYRRGAAYVTLGDPNSAALAFEKAAITYPSSNLDFKFDELVEYAAALQSSGKTLEGLKILQDAQTLALKGGSGWIMTIDRLLILSYSGMGDFQNAKKLLGDMEVHLASLKSRMPNSRYLLTWNAQFDWCRGVIFLREGRSNEAIRALQTAAIAHKRIIENLKNSTKDALDNEQRFVQDATTSSRAFNSRLAVINENLAAAYVQNKQFIEAELAAREALRLGIENTGVNSPLVSRSLRSLANVLLEAGRASEAFLIANEALKKELGTQIDPTSLRLVLTRKVLATSLAVDKKYADADKAFTEMVNGFKSNPEAQAAYRPEDLNWVLSMVKIGKNSQALEMSDTLLKQSLGRLDKNSPSLAMTRAFHASALQADGKGSQATVEFAQAVPILIEQAQNDAENSTGSVLQTQRLNFVLSNYLGLLAQTSKTNPTQSSASVNEAFQIADVARGSGVQRALTESAARASIKDPQLANLARQEQDLQRRINTLSALLTGLLSTPANQQLPGVQTKLKADIETFKSQRDSIKKEIEKKFPEYAELVDPKPASVERTQKLLKPDEVLVTWYFDDKVGYVWAVSKDAPVQFAQLPIGRAQIAKEVAQLRKSLDPGVATIDEIPAFDVALANRLYQQVLAPVEAALKGKKVMLVVPHADLGQIPLAVLVTKATTQPVKSGILFAGYKSVPFLAKDIAVAQIPSVTALTALRSLPEGNPNRKSFIGFGDPYFSAQQEKTAEKQAKVTQLATRGIPLALRSAPKTTGVSSAELALLPRLPDTSLEIEAIAKVVGAGPDDIYLHKQASVKQVMSMDLSNRKVVMFSTHGLVPGELNGLTQPALALSSPDVTGDNDDGLLTMDKVIGLKLDADWVVLSACNTASGEGAGSEAVSGLGRAFFFAGTKALLVSNWPVDSVASRQLMTDLFKRQQENKSLQKSEALRQAMLAQIDQGGVREGNTMKYSYAHPLFWAPFVVVGD